ncbi:MAG: hypothetical protein RI964_2389 [Pseudomonadota bacterium]|jgi:hypothetical protein
MRNQKGATFITWVAGVGLILFIFITGIKLMPLYLEFYAVRNLVDKIATDPDVTRANTMQIRRKVDDFLNINGLYTLSASAFSIAQVEGKKDTRALAVNYEVRKHWVANIDFLVTFTYSAELGKAGDS